MQIDYSPENFVLIFQNSTWLSSTYCFIKVLPEWEMASTAHRLYNTNHTGIKFKVDGAKSPYILDVGAICDKKQFGTKKDWVAKTIEGQLFDTSVSYLYLHTNDVLGYYSFCNKTFTPFADNDMAHILMHQFFYRMMCLTDKTINWVSSRVNLLSNCEYDETELADESDDDSDAQCNDSEEEVEEVVVVLQTGPVIKKK
jgi:hypothetical protein